jgi:hypothetical protein
MASLPVTEETQWRVHVHWADETAGLHPMAWRSEGPPPPLTEPPNPHHHLHHLHRRHHHQRHQHLHTTRRTTTNQVHTCTRHHPTAGGGLDGKRGPHTPCPSRRAQVGWRPWFRRGHPRVWLPPAAGTPATAAGRQTTRVPGTSARPTQRCVAAWYGRHSMGHGAWGKGQAGPLIQCNGTARLCGGVLSRAHGCTRVPSCHAVAI